MNRKQKNDLETSVHSVSSVAMAFYAGWGIVQTPSERLEARVKCQTLSGECSAAIIQTVSGKSAITQTVSAQSVGGIKANVFASRYMTVLPDEETLRMEIVKTQRAMKQRCLPESRMQRRNET